MKIYVEDGNLKATKSCDICAHQNTCKFYSKAKELFKSNEFYEMTEYLEWNNNLSSWSENKRCQFYLPYLFDKKLFEIELERDKTYINAYGGWYDLVNLFFMDNHMENHKEYFDEELLKQREKIFANEMTDGQLFNHCVKRSSCKNIYNISANDESWKYEISLIEILEHFNAFKEI